MLLRDSKSASILAFPAVATTALVLFLVRNRQITNSGSPGSGVTIAGTELLVRVSAIIHAAVSIGAQGFSLLLRIATAPVIFALSTVEAEFRVGLGAIDGINGFLQHAAVYLIHAL